MQNDPRDFREYPLQLIQITDTHLYRDPRAALLGLNTQQSFEKVIDLIASQRETPDAIIATGDIAQDAEVESYHRFAEGIARFSAPFYWVPGNHDCRKVMHSLPEYQAANAARVVLGNWQLLMLDSSVENEVHGFLSETELDRLEQHLAHLPEGVEHSLIFLHHNPVPGMAEWMSDIGLRNANVLLDVIGNFSASVRAISYGHIHQALDFKRDGLRFFCTPSTCIQFKPHAGEFELDIQAPAYRWFKLHADGRIETDVERLQNYNINVDMNAVGY